MTARSIASAQSGPGDLGVHVVGTLPLPQPMPNYLIWQGDVETFLAGLPGQPLFDLVVTSPPYNLGKEYEGRLDLSAYLAWQERIIRSIVPRIGEGGSLCWEVGNYVKDNIVTPLDIELAPIFRDLGLKLRNRIVWRFGHGLHCRNRFSGRYEVILWYTKSDSYTFNLDAVRIDAKYPGKKYYKGPRAGQYSSHPEGKNPEDVWDNIPNVKSNHVEKTGHPCQFPVGLIERLVLALTNEGDLVFDPFAGVASAGVAAAAHRRRFWGCELFEKYCMLGSQRLARALLGTEPYRRHDQPLYDHTKSPLSRKPAGRQKPA